MWRSVRLLILVGALAASIRALPTRAAQFAPYPVIPADQLLRYLDAVDRRLDYVPGEALVKFKDGVTPDGHARALQAATGLPPSGGLTWVGEVALVRDLAQPDARILAAELAAQPEVLYAEPNYIGHLDSAPNDPSYATRQWNLQQLNMPRVWDISPGATADVVVAMIDSGVTAVAAQSLAAKTWSGTAIVNVSVPVAPSPEFALSRFTNPRDFSTNPSSPGSLVFDSDGHGTHTGSTVGEGTNNNLSLAGIAYNATIMPLKVCITYWDLQFSRSAAGIGGFQPLADSFCPTDATVAAIYYAADHGAHVINMSLGGFPDSPVLRDALDYAVKRGVFVAISNGNSFTEGNAPSYPAAFAPKFEGVMSVAAANRNNGHAWYSTTNPQTEIMAYGGDTTLGLANGVWQLTLRFFDSDPETVIFPRFDRYEERSFQGTSMAAPHVAAFAALLHSRGVTSPAAKEAVIKATALDVGATGRDDTSGYGLIQPVRALFGLGVNR